MCWRSAPSEMITWSWQTNFMTEASMSWLASHPITCYQSYQAGGAPFGELHLQLISENLNKPHSCCVWWSGGSCSHKPLARPHTSNGLVIEIHYMLPPPNKPASFLKFPTVGRWSAMCLTGRKWHTRFWKWYAESVQPGFSYCCDLLHKRHVRSVFLKFHGSTGQESKAGK